MVEGHGPVEGLLAAVYFGDVDETKEGYAPGLTRRGRAALP